MYPAEIVIPMKQELTSKGFTELLTPTAVDEALKNNETVLIVINSVCGCSAGSARPGVIKAVNQASKKPILISTLFAGFDVEAVQRLRQYLLPFPPSSPSMALFQKGELVHFIERHQIEGHSADVVADNLITAFEKFC